MSTEKLSVNKQSTLEVYRSAKKEEKAILERVFGASILNYRPIGIWCVTQNSAVRPCDWEKFAVNNPTDKAIGIGVVTDNTSFMVSLDPSVALQFGATDTDNYPDVCCDTESFDNEAATAGIIETHKGVVCKYNDSGKFDFTGSPAASWCASQGESLPTLATGKIIVENIKEINDALRKVNGYHIPPGWHWTSTIKTEASAYLVDMHGGNVFNRNKSTTYYVRAVSAFHFSDFNF